MYNLTCPELMGLPDTKYLLLKVAFWSDYTQFEPDKVVVVNRPS
jgi:hypothetical protein